MQQLIALDGQILLWIQEYVRQDWMNGFWTAITRLGDGGWFWIALSLVLLCFKRTRKAGAAGLLALALGALITNVALKNLVARIRPYEVVNGLVCLIEKQKDFSFPSGHTCASFAAAAAYYKILPKRYGVSALVLAALIAFSRLYVGVHYPTDILGGLAVGLFAAWVALKLAEYIGKKLKKEPMPENERSGQNM